MLPEWAAPELQKARSQLRRKFLRTLDNFIGKECQITMHDDTLVRARFSGWDVETQNILVSDLHTPNGLIESAVLRATDIIHIEFNEEADAAVKTSS